MFLCCMSSTRVQQGPGVELVITSACLPSCRDTHHHKPEARPGIPAVRSFKVYHSKLLELLVIIEVPSITKPCKGWGRVKRCVFWYTKRGGPRGMGTQAERTNRWRMNLDCNMKHSRFGPKSTCTGHHVLSLLFGRNDIFTTIT